MAGLFGSLELAKKSLITNQYAFQVIGHNIANINTDNYTRRRIDLSPSSSVQLGGNTYGTGVDIAQVHGVRDRFLEYQIQKETQNSGKQESMSGYFEIVEALFSEKTSTGIGTSMQSFFNSWSDLSNNPTGLAERYSVVSKGTILASKVKEIYTQLSSQQAIQDNTVYTTVQTINTAAQEIASINTKISAGLKVGEEMNDLRDRRNVLLEELGTQVGINVYENEAGEMTVEMAGKPFIVGGTYHPLEISRNGANHNFYDVSLTQSGPSVNITSSIKTGALGGILEMRDKTIPAYQNQLDSLAYGIITNVNAIHSTGYDTQGGTPTDFFVPFTPATAGDYTGAALHFEVNPDLVADPNRVAASSVNGEVGNNKVAMALADLQRATSVVDSDNDGTFDAGTFSDYYGKLTTKIGAEALTTYSQETASGEVLVGLKNRRDEVSGVSLDEESSSLIQYEKAYQAMARFMNVISDMTDILVNLGS